jgi:hypothetical protein
VRGGLERTERSVRKRKSEERERERDNQSVTGELASLFLAMKGVAYKKSSRTAARHPSSSLKPGKYRVVVAIDFMIGDLG